MQSGMVLLLIDSWLYRKQKEITHKESTKLAPAWPCMTRFQCSHESRPESCGSDPIAVGYSNSSAPWRARARAASGNHWSQQIAVDKMENKKFQIIIEFNINMTLLE
jgi:hypothetical protein